MRDAAERFPARLSGGYIARVSAVSGTGCMPVVLGEPAMGVDADGGDIVSVVLVLISELDEAPGMGAGGAIGSDAGMDSVVLAAVDVAVASAGGGAP